MSARPRALLLCSLASLVCAPLPLAPRAARAQDSVIDAVIDPGIAAPSLGPPQPATIPSRIGAPARAAIERLADSVRAAGAPTAPLYAKAAEGVLKGADDARIVVAVRRLARELTDARAALGATAPEGDVVAAASALHAGVPAATLQRLRTTHAARDPSASLALPYVILADLASRGVPPDDAAASMTTLLARGADAAELTAFRAGVERDLVAGRDPGSALGARTRSAVERIERGRP